MVKGRFGVRILAVVVLLLALCLPGIIFYGEKGDFGNLFYALIVPLLAFLSGLVLFFGYIRGYLLFVSLFILFSPLAAFPVVYFGDLVGRDMLVVTFNTTFREAFELIGGYIPIILVTYLIYIFLIIYSIKNLPKRISFKQTIIISFAALLLLISFSMFRYGRGNILKNLKGAVYSYYPFRVIYSLHTFYKQQELVSWSESYIKNFPYKNVSIKKEKSREVYVLLIGESSRYDHWGINGYSRPTTTLLVNCPHFLDYRSASAAGCITELSVPQILTGVNPYHYYDHLRKGGILQLFHQAGFKTFWISNQTDQGNIRMHANLADSSIWIQNTSASTKHLHYDMELIDKMKAILRYNKENCLFVIHTYGSHYAYTSRYPDTYKRFNPVWSDQSIVPTDMSNKEELVNAYDNSIVYTSVVVDSVLNILDRLNCVSALLYTSDHGENLFDDSRQLVLHAPIPPSSYIAHVPFFIYCTRDYINAFPLKWNYLSLHVSRRISNNQTFETLVDMADIKYRGQNLKNSLADSAFEDSRQAILGPNSKIYYYSKLQ